MKFNQAVKDTIIKPTPLELPQLEFYSLRYNSNTAAVSAGFYRFY
jgi:hypothetical protein